MIGEQQWITIPQAASLLDLRKRTVKRWVRSGRLQSWRDGNGNLGVSLKDVESLRRELFAGVTELPSREIHKDPLFEGNWNGLDDKDSDAETMGEFIADTTVKNVRRNAPNPAPEPAPEPKASASTASSESSQAGPRDPLSALEHQAERSIQVAGAAYHEAKELAVAYREELQSARKEHREELHRVRRMGHVAWLLVAISVLVILAGSWYVGRQYGDQKLYETRVANLSERLGSTSQANEKLQSRIEALRKESSETETQLRTAKLGQADAVGQLAAYRAHSEQLAHRVDVLETQIQQERTARDQVVRDAKLQAVQVERKRLAYIRQERAEQAERQRQNMLTTARAQREEAERQQQEMIRSQQQLQEQQRKTQTLAEAQQGVQQKEAPPTRDESLAKIDQRTRAIRGKNVNANLTLTELEQAMTPKR